MCLGQNSNPLAPTVAPILRREDMRTRSTSATYGNGAGAGVCPLQIHLLILVRDVVWVWAESQGG